MPPPQPNLVIAVTPRGPLRFNSVEDAIASVHTTLADPFYWEGGPIDRTLIRGPGLDDYDGASDPWPLLVDRAVELPEPVKKGR